MKPGIRVTKPLLIAVVLGITLLSGFVLAGQYLLHRCLWRDCAPERSFRVSELELPATLFPDEVTVNQVYPLSDEFGTIDDGAQSIYWDTGNAVYVIYRYPTIRRAIVGFDRNQHLLFSGTEEVWPSIADSILSGTRAGLTYIACGDQSINNKQCAMVARFQEYVVSFSANIDDRMTYADFEKIVV